VVEGLVRFLQQATVIGVEGVLHGEVLPNHEGPFEHEHEAHKKVPFVDNLRRADVPGYR
jgi:hypothetical protein